jgi:hypothetical protein
MVCRSHLLSVPTSKLTKAETGPFEVIEIEFRVRKRSAFWPGGPKQGSNTTGDFGEKALSYGI